MSDKENLPQEVMDDLITDPDKDASERPAPKPPQTVSNEPEGSAGKR